MDRKKAEHLVYLNSSNYMSLSSLWGLYLYGIGIMSVILIGIACITKSIPLGIVTGLYFIYPLCFILPLYSKRVKKTFALHYLTNGLASLSILFTFILIYLVFEIFYVHATAKDILLIAILYGIYFVGFFAVSIYLVRTNFYKNLKEKTKSKKYLALEAMAGACIPISGIIGKHVSRSIGHDSEISYVIFECVSVLGICIVTFGLINFVQYFYCVKYKITCDENGLETSNGLNPPTKEERLANKKKKQKEKKKIWKKKSIGSKIWYFLWRICVIALVLFIAIRIGINLIK